MSELAKALLAFQKEAPELHKDSTAVVKTKTGGEYRYKYMSFDQAMAAIRPVLNKHGLVISQQIQIKEGHRALETFLTHAEDSSSWWTSTVLLPDTDDMQALGSAITYARRYSLISMLGLVADEDDDGAKSQRRTQEVAKPDTKTPQDGHGQFDYEPDPVLALRGKFVVIFKRLQEQAPRQEGQPSWAEELQAWTYQEFGKTDSAELSEGELEALCNHANGLLHAEGLATV